MYSFWSHKCSIHFNYMSMCLSSLIISSFKIGTIFKTSNLELTFKSQALNCNHFEAAHYQTKRSKPQKWNENRLDNPWNFFSSFLEEHEQLTLRLVLLPCLLLLQRPVLTHSLLFEFPAVFLHSIKNMNIFGRLTLLVFFYTTSMAKKVLSAD